MAHFVNWSKKYYLSTNYKVMYSTLRAQSNLTTKTGRLRRINNLIRFFKQYLIVRNPYDRLESFYKDKFVMHPRQFQENIKDWNVEHNQEIFLNEMGFYDMNDREKIVRLLKSTSWQDFLQLLPACYLRDWHVKPQGNILQQGLLGFDYIWRPDRILKMESTSDMLFLSDKLAINTRIIKNSTSDIDANIIWNLEQRTLVNEIYKDDFKLFEYKIIS